MGIELHIGKMTVLEICFTTMNNLTLLNYILKMDKIVNFMLYIFYYDV